MTARGDGSADRPYEGCHWDCTLHNGANGCLRRKLDPELQDDFCVGGHVCAMEWPEARTCATCYKRDRKSIVACIYDGYR